MLIQTQVLLQISAYYTDTANKFCGILLGHGIRVSRSFELHSDCTKSELDAWGNEKLELARSIDPAIEVIGWLYVNSSAALNELVFPDWANNLLLVHLNHGRVECLCYKRSNNISYDQKYSQWQKQPLEIETDKATEISVASAMRSTGIHGAHHAYLVLLDKIRQTQQILRDGNPTEQQKAVRQVSQLLKMPWLFKQKEATTESDNVNYEMMARLITLSDEKHTQ